MEIANFFQKNRMIAEVERTKKSKHNSLNLEDYDLMEFPEIILHCDNIRNLILQRNRISQIPENIGTHLKNLKYLSLQFNKLSSFPTCLKTITDLISLNISHNPIKALINDIDCFQSLKYLWCNSCELSSLPEALGNLFKLDTLGARNNQIAILPTTIVNLKELRWLSLEDNNLYSLPDNFYKLTSLLHLNINRNCFNSIPSVLTKTFSLMYLHMQNNFIKSLEKETVLALSFIKLNLLHNPIENIKEFKDFKHLILVLKYEKNNSINETETRADSSEWDSYWENSTDTMYLNYDSSSESSESDHDECVTKMGNISKFFVGH